jgi:hypothetical protein
MTAPAITYGHGKLDDSWSDLDDYTFTAAGSTGTYGITTGYNLYMEITSFVGDVHIENDTNFALSTTLYPYIMFQYATEGAAKAKVVAVFSDASTQTLLAETASLNAWSLELVALTAAKTLDHLVFYGCDDEGSVYYDFFLVCKGVFTFPQYSKVTYNMQNRYSNTEVPSRLGRRKAWMGANEMVITIDGDIDHQDAGWSRELDTIAAQVLNEIHHNAHSEAWQWLLTDRATFKAVMEDLVITESNEQDYLFAFQVVFSEFRLDNAANESANNRLGF